MQTTSTKKTAKSSIPDTQVCALSRTERTNISTHLGVMLDDIELGCRKKQIDFSQHDPLQMQYLSAAHILHQRTSDHLRVIRSQYLDMLLRMTEHMMIGPTHSKRLELMVDMEFIKQEITFITQLEAAKI